MGRVFQALVKIVSKEDGKLTGTQDSCHDDEPIGFKNVEIEIQPIL